jgi:hypothetical protein
MFPFRENGHERETWTNWSSPLSTKSPSRFGVPTAIPVLFFWRNCVLSSIFMCFANWMGSVANDAAHRAITYKLSHRNAFLLVYPHNPRCVRKQQGMTTIRVIPDHVCGSQASTGDDDGMGRPVFLWCLFQLVWLIGKALQELGQFLQLASLLI